MLGPEAKWFSLIPLLGRWAARLAWPHGQAIAQSRCSGADKRIRSTPKLLAYGRSVPQRLEATSSRHYLEVTPRPWCVPVRRELDHNAKQSAASRSVRLEAT